MKLSRSMIAILSILPLSIGSAITSKAQSEISAKELIETTDSDIQAVDSSLFIVRDVATILNETDTHHIKPLLFNKMVGPWIFTGYRHIPSPKNFDVPYSLSYPGMTIATGDTISETEEKIEIMSGESPSSNLTITEEKISTEIENAGEENKNPMLDPEYVPDWLKNSMKQMRMQEDLIYKTMVYTPSSIDYAYWDLPLPPTLADDEVTFEAYIRNLNLPEIELEKAIIPETEIRKIHWLHNVNAMAQFSQAYVSSNWYQGGNDHIALLLGANWNVQLNQVYHPDLLFQSNLSYKLGLNSTPQDQVHKYSISEDIFQWNLNTGLKAKKSWYYSFNVQFKTQLFNNYLPNSHTRKASFLSPGDFNMGLGMAYSHKKPTLEYTLTLSPFSYNLKTCITDKIDHAQFNIRPDRKTHSEFGSNAEINLNWKIRYNINYKTRLFLFSDYKYFLADWENTLNFEINKFLSTQIYVHVRYDTSTEALTKWKHFMLREVLSFGLSYTFSTK